MRTGLLKGNPWARSHDPNNRQWQGPGPDVRQHARDPLGASGCRALCHRRCHGQTGRDRVSRAADSLLPPDRGGLVISTRHHQGVPTKPPNASSGMAWGCALPGHSSRFRPGIWAVAVLPLTTAITLSVAQVFFVALLAVWVLGEPVGWHRIGAAVAVIAVRSLSQTESTATVLVYQAGFAAFLSGIPLFWLRVTPDLQGLILLLTMGAWPPLANGAASRRCAWAKRASSETCTIHSSSMLWFLALSCLAKFWTPRRQRGP